MNKVCVAPEEIEDWALQAYADGEQLPAVADHLRRCPACAARVASLSRLEARLTSVLYRFDCPTLDDLRAFVWRALPPARRQPLADHLAVCVPCQEEVTALGRTLTAPGRPIGRRVNEQPHSMGLIGSLRTIWGQLMRPVLVPAAALRGLGRRQAFYRAGEVDVALTIETSGGQHLLLGQALGISAGVAGRVFLCDLNGVEVARTGLDETGSFVLTGLPAPPWELHLRLTEGGEAVREVVLVTVGLESPDD